MRPSYLINILELLLQWDKSRLHSATPRQPGISSAPSSYRSLVYGAEQRWWVWTPAVLAESSCAHWWRRRTWDTDQKPRGLENPLATEPYPQMHGSGAPDHEMRHAWQRGHDEGNYLLSQNLWCWRSFNAKAILHRSSNAFCVGSEQLSTLPYGNERDLRGADISIPCCAAVKNSLDCYNAKVG
ncbi:hypothetical protein BD410DRAFT_808999 [Rickenella mellea]|uniref:Uncharacterized protein n=1 Tax=Rickenella mellea TaxID=50990 RepID=A0A4Y7PJT9_9AGAM|nr:hypothetical protein BD410DRAFT_808999 [Rickenella mellea]